MRVYTVDYTCDWCRKTVTVKGGDAPKDWRELTSSPLADISGGAFPQTDDICSNCARDLRSLKRKRQNERRLNA